MCSKRRDLNKMGLCFPFKQELRYQVPNQGPRAVRWGHSWLHGWNLAKKTLWRYPIWGPNRSSPEAEANTDKKHSGKATAHGTGMIKYLISPTDYRLQAIFFLTHSYAYPKLQNLQSEEVDGCQMSFLSLTWWGFLLLHKNPGVENVHVIRDSQLSIHQHNLPGSHLHYPVLRSLQCPPTPDLNADRSLALDIALHSLEASFHTLPRHVPVNLHIYYCLPIDRSNPLCSKLPRIVLINP